MAVRPGRRPSPRTAQVIAANSGKPLREDFPLVSRDLLEALEARYPDRCPELSTEEKEVWFASGCAHVIRQLRMAYEAQTQ